MLVFKALEKLKKHLNSKTLKIGLVPTMGGLHKGHLSLVEKACSDNDLVVVSIYINPTQFNDQNDLKNSIDLCYQTNNKNYKPGDTVIVKNMPDTVLQVVQVF